MEELLIRAGDTGGGTEAIPRTVIVLDDDEAARGASTALLETLGYVVHAFPSCEAFLRTELDLAGACLLIDHEFDGMTGLELLDILSAYGVVLPTVLYSGRLNPRLLRRARSHRNVVAIIEKPLGGRHLTQALAKAFAARG